MPSKTRLPITGDTLYRRLTVREAWARAGTGDRNWVVAGLHSHVQDPGKCGACKARKKFGSAGCIPLHVVLRLLNAHPAGKS